MEKASWEDRLAKLPDRAAAARQRQIIEQGICGSLRQGRCPVLHAKILKEVEASLAKSKWLAGENFTLADIAIIPYVTRLDRLGLDGMWAAYPNVTRWFSNVQSRKSFETAITAVRSNAC